EYRTTAISRMGAVAVRPSGLGRAIYINHRLATSVKQQLFEEAMGLTRGELVYSTLWSIHSPMKVAYRRRHQDQIFESETRERPWGKPKERQQLGINLQSPLRTAMRNTTLGSLTVRESGSIIDRSKLRSPRRSIISKKLRFLRACANLYLSIVHCQYLLNFINVVYLLQSSDTCVILQTAICSMDHNMVPRPPTTSEFAESTGKAVAC
ncbi:hypothetical protein FOL47_007203, partial [Perkinsus chesapeaki]